VARGLTRGVRFLLGLVLISACATSPDAPLSSATFTPDASVRTSRAKGAFVSYGAPYHKWGIEFGTVESCGGDVIAEIELTTLSGVTDLPVGSYPLRATEMPATVPTAYLRYGANTGIDGMLVIESVTPTFVTGSFTGNAMINGVATPITADFGSPVCL
jgi:hypothetical protein